MSELDKTSNKKKHILIKEIDLSCRKVCHSSSSSVIHIHPHSFKLKKTIIVSKNRIEIELALFRVELCITTEKCVAKGVKPNMQSFRVGHYQSAVTSWRLYLYN